VSSAQAAVRYQTLIAATISDRGPAMTVWAHHMFTTGAVLLPFLLVHDSC